MTGKTRPISIRLATSEIEQMHARAHRLSANISGVIRDPIRTGLTGGDNKALADRLMRIRAPDRHSRTAGPGDPHAGSID
ncbi:hypothetical protein LQG66_01030 [Bradyrhizobium ontarionense]|uniref:Plasmid stabilization protein n=1 Tax=Bradyrhizobium ontarionense TaxID=2898149 RepID=A0ABY3RC72_9BRAD|nr:hypothetical protein [Bradyrhizobium sp. A19]UFZ04936.1 hypothetical protein LQG66_01030 [Bradyrhizobium sp. A19]